MTQHVFPGGRKVESGFETVYTVEQTAALVEEIKAKTYDGVKARFLTLLEALLQAKGLGTSSIGRMVDILLQDVDDQVLAIAGKHAPEITAAAVAEARDQREQAEFDAKHQGLEMRAHHLKERAANAEWTLKDFEQRVEWERKQKMHAMLGGNPSPETVDAVLAVLETTKGSLEPGPFVTAIQRGKKAFAQIDAREKKQP